MGEGRVRVKLEKNLRCIDSSLPGRVGQEVKICLNKLKKIARKTFPPWTGRVREGWSYNKCFLIFFINSFNIII